MAVVLMCVLEFLLSSPAPNSPVGRDLLSERYPDLRRLLVQIRCACRQHPALESRTDLLIGRITIWVERRRTDTVQAVGLMYLNYLRGMIENFGGRLPMPGVEHVFGETVIDRRAVSIAQRVVVLGPEAVFDEFEGDRVDESEGESEEGDFDDDA
jgi:hypothetical protein